jgi:hypothetical protein
MAPASAVRPQQVRERSFAVNNINTAELGRLAYSTTSMLLNAQLAVADVLQQVRLGAGRVGAHESVGLNDGNMIAASPLSVPLAMSHTSK